MSAVTRTATAYAAVDLGASSGRVTLGVLTGTGLQFTEVHRFANTPVTVDRRLVWDVERLFKETLAGLAKAAIAAAEADAVLSGIGVDSWGVDYALLSGDAEAWPTVEHYRAAPNPADVVANRSRTEEEVYALTGVPDQSINTGIRLARAARDGALPTGRMLFVPDLWVHRLTGIAATEATIASTSQLLSAETGDWAPELLEAYGLTGLDLPPVRTPGSFAGLTTPAVTQRIGVAAGVPVFRVAGHDTASAFAFAEPVRARDGAAQEAAGEEAVGLISSGTWSLVGVCAASPVLDARALRHGFTNERGLRGTLFIRNLNGMWLLQQCIAEWEAEDGRAPEVANLLDAAAGVAGDDRVFDVADPRLLAPGDMVGRIAQLCSEAGRPRPQGRADVVRAIVDSLATAYAGSLADAARLTGVRLRTVRIVGGGSQNDLLCRLTADRTGLPVIAGPVEASSIGNIAAQIVVSGARPSVAEVYAAIADDSALTTHHPNIAQETSRAFTESMS